ncbi:MAG: GTPase, partial [Erysipelotrichales bacterium]|nr:GTPase [Erysipelotrichales bacterium]
MLKNAKFVLSAPNKNSWVDDDIPEIILLGRSNVGKSTLINAITGNNKIAKVSSTPGRTRLLNFFDINNGE